MLLFARRGAWYCTVLGAGCWLQPCLAPALPSPAQVRIISFGVMLFLPMTLLSLAVLLPINYTSDFYLYMGVRRACGRFCLRGSCWQCCALLPLAGAAALTAMHAAQASLALGCLHNCRPATMGSSWTPTLAPSCA